MVCLMLDASFMLYAISNTSSPMLMICLTVNVLLSCTTVPSSPIPATAWNLEKSYCLPFGAPTTKTAKQSSYVKRDLSP